MHPWSPFILLASAFASPPGARAPAASTEAVPFVHIQTDRPEYRLGEVIWFRAHAPISGEVTVRLVDPAGREVSTRAVKTEKGKKASGSFPIPGDAAGGIFRIEARLGELARHEIELEVHALELPRALLDLTILGHVHGPGDPLAAAFRARDLRGRPIVGAAVEYRATFGDTVLRAAAGHTDADGRALLRITLPPGAVEGGHLAVAVRLSSGEAAIARRVEVSTPVETLDAFPEGGSFIEGWPQKVALLLRDADGKPTAAEGRVVDDTGATAAAFETDATGLVAVTVPGSAGRTYRAVVRGAGGRERSFTLPGPTGHTEAMAVEETEGSFRVTIASRKGLPREHLVLVLEGEGRVISRRNLLLRSGGEGGGEGIAIARAVIPRPSLRGLGHLLLLRGDRAVLRRTVFQGSSAPIAVTLKPTREGPYLPGETLDCIVEARREGRPVEADLALSVFQGSEEALEDLAARFYLEPSLPRGPRIPRRILDDPERREAFLLAHDARSYPAGGAPLEPGGLPGAETGRIPLVRAPGRPSGEAASAGAPPPTVEPGAASRTVVVSATLERALEAAPYTRLIEEEERPHAFRLDVPPETLAAAPGEPGVLLPQDIAPAPRSVDTRRTLFWDGRVRTNRAGLAGIRFRLSHVVSDVAWVAQGFAGDAPASGRGSLRTDPDFQTRFEAPEHLLAGDVFDLMLGVEDRKPGSGRIDIEVFPPPSLKPLLRTRVSVDARNDAALQRFRFQALSPSEGAEIRVSARRGIHEEVHARRVRVDEPGTEVAHGDSGCAAGLRRLEVRIPADAIPGSVRSRAAVLPGYAAEALELSESLMREPTGCFEQWTSTNYSNLAVLDALLEAGGEPRMLERAFLHAEQGLRKLREHRSPGGGYAMFPGGPAELVATAIALPHLLLLERIGRGRGRAEVDAAVEWLEKRKLEKTQELYLTFMLHDAGRLWSRSEKALRSDPEGSYETVLQAAGLARWPGAPPDGLKAKAGSLLDAIESWAAPGWEVSGGGGIVGSTGERLASEVLALSVLALHGGGREAPARWLAGELRRRGTSLLGTQGTALAVRALGRVNPLAASAPLEVTFDGGPAGGRQVQVRREGGDPLYFEEKIRLAPGDSSTLALEIGSPEPRPYRLGYAYRTNTLRSSPTAPYTLETSMPGVADLKGSLSLRLVVKPRGPAGSSQVVARIGLPGGVEVQDELREPAQKAGIAHWEVRDGFLDLYWATPPSKVVRLDIPLRPVVAGRFRARPSVIAPYYEAGREHFTAPLALHIQNPYGIDAPLPGDPGRPRRFR